MQSIRNLSFLHIFCKAFYAEHSNSCTFTPIENWTLVYMNLLTRNSPYYHLIKHLLFLLKHSVCGERVSVGLGIQHAMRMCRIILSSVACPTLSIFPHFLIKGITLDETKKVTDRRICVMIFSATFFFLKHFSF